eukprot:g2762.t1
MAAFEDVPERYQENVRPVLDLVDDLRKIGVQQDLPIPQIAVMGDQSSGKSSVLEAISGIPFPRGAGLVTRCATQLSMSKGPEWSAELRAKDERTTVKNKEDLAKEIENLTNKLCGGDDKVIWTEDAIEIKLVAPDVPDLTIIDLPGIVRSKIQGQADSIIENVDALLNKYLEDKRTVILAVIPANQDIATNDILRRAEKVDPSRSRTMGVLTKPDLVDKGGEQDVIAVLANRMVELKHGFVMVKNRGQDDLNKELTIEQARKNETNWFKGAGSLYAEDGNRVGVDALSNALTDLLVSQIYADLPDIRNEIVNNLQRAEDGLLALGLEPPESPSGCRAVVADLIRSWAESLRKISIKADYLEIEVKDKGDEDDMLRLVLYERRMRKIFAAQVQASRPGFDGEHDEFKIKVIEGKRGHDHAKDDILEERKLDEPRSITKIGDKVTYADCDGEVFELTKYFRGDLAEKIEIRRGRELPGFMNFDVFTGLVGEYISCWRGFAGDFREKILNAMEAAAVFIVDKHVVHMPTLAGEMKKRIRSGLQAADKKADLRLEELLQGELLPSTENHYLWDTLNKIRNDRMVAKIDALGEDEKLPKAVVVAMLKSDIGNSSNESQEVQDMIDLLAAYWKLAAKRYIDEVGMIVHSEFTSAALIKGLESSLSQAFMAAEDIYLQRCFQQTSEQERRRAKLQATAKRMRAANDRINKQDFLERMPQQASPLSADHGESESKGPSA